MEKDNICTHIREISEIKKEKVHECAECMKTGSRWVHLRTCQTCGETLCCDSSPNKHMTAHFHELGHPVASSAEPGEKWLWCYQDSSFVEYS